MEQKQEFIINNEAGLEIVVDFTVGLLSDSAISGTTLIALSGDLGAGKTTFTKQLAAKLGVTETITSPTFVIQKRYQINNPSIKEKFEHLVHIDAYRLADSNELQKLSFEQTLNSPEQKNIICLEWPEIVPESIPEKHIAIRFEHQEDTGRKVTVESNL